MDERFYVLLAVVIAAVILVDFTFTQLIGALDGTKYDKLIHYRLASPAASPDIVIVDIDERSLAIVGAQRGRWPWPRDVLAEAIATIAEAGPRALFVNVIFSEADPAHPDADRALQEVAAAYPFIVHPFVRLPPENDRHSQLDASRLPNARPLAGRGVVPDPVAVVLPAFADLQRNLGAANLYQDDDGIIRSYEYWLHTDAHALPSAATAMLLAARAEAPPSGDGLLPRLNWRNKRGDYERVSFADLYDGIRGKQGFDATRFAGKFVVLGASAAGIAVVKATSAEIATDDNTIIATALDDALSGTALKQVPPAINVALAVLLIAVFAWAFVAQVDQATVDSVFAIAQASLVAITFVSVSYMTVILDMTLPFKAAAAYFVVARSFHAAKYASQRGVARFWDTAQAQRADRAVVIASQGVAENRRTMTRVRRILERGIGYERVLHVSDFIDRGTFLGHKIGDIELIVGFLDNTDTTTVASLPQELRGPGFEVIEVDLAGKGVEESREALWHTVVAGVFAARGK
jgi:CHASE2 domain-containing sensor protein